MTEQNQQIIEAVRNVSDVGIGTGLVASALAIINDWGGALIILATVIFVIFRAVDMWYAIRLKRDKLNGPKS